MMIKFILYAFISAFLLRDVTAVDCGQVQNCYAEMFKSILGRDVNYTMMTYDSYSGIYSTAFSMWEGYQAICPIQNNLQTCLKNGGLEGCINPTDLSKLDFVVKNGDVSSANYYVYHYLRYNFLCSELNNTGHDTYTCVRDYLYNFNQPYGYNTQNRIPSSNCSNYQPDKYVGPDCFTYPIYLECVTNYANAVCGEQSKCMTKKLYTLDMCAIFDRANKTCQACKGSLVGSSDYLTDVCTDSSQNNSGTLSTLSFTLLFFVTLVFHLFC